MENSTPKLEYVNGSISRYKSMCLVLECPLWENWRFEGITTPVRHPAVDVPTFILSQSHSPHHLDPHSILRNDLYYIIHMVHMSSFLEGLCRTLCVSLMGLSVSYRIGNGLMVIGHKMIKVYSIYRFKISVICPNSGNFVGRISVVEKEAVKSWRTKQKLSGCGGCDGQWMDLHVAKL